MKIHITKNGQNLGPYDTEEVKKQLLAGIISSNDMAWQEGMTDWRPLGTFPGIQSQSASQAPRLPQNASHSSKTRFGYSHELRANRSTEDCLRIAMQVLENLGSKPIRDTNFSATGTQGMGWAIRLLGAILAPVEWFPIRLRVTVNDDGETRLVTVMVEENFGFGTLVGVETKIRNHCEKVSNQLSAQLGRYLS